MYQRAFLSIDIPHDLAGSYSFCSVSHIDSIVGILEPGKSSDVIVVKGNPLKDLHTLFNIRLVIHNGINIRAEE